MRDWHAWHDEYNDPTSWQYRRLALAQEFIQHALDKSPPGRLSVVDICAGEGRDLLPALAAHPRKSDVRAILVEKDQRNAEAARKSADDYGLLDVSIVVGNAALTDHYMDYVPADLLLLGGVFPHISLAHRTALVKYARAIVKRDGLVMWTMNTPMATQQLIGAFLVRHFEPVLATNETEQHSVVLMRHVDNPQTLYAGQVMFKFVGMENLGPHER